RLLRMHPEARRSLEFWQRFDVALREAADATPKLDAAKMTRSVMQAKPRPGTVSSWLDFAALSRVLILGSSLAMIALLAWSNAAPKKNEAPPLGIVVTAIAQEGPEHADSPVAVVKSAPVEIRLGELSSSEERERAPVTIRF